MPGFAAQAADGAQAATSSSGRQPGMSPAEREDYLRRSRNRAAERAALAVPPFTGDALADLAAAEEHFGKVDGLWDELDIRLKQARAEAGAIPAAADAAEIADLQRRTDIAWASRQAAKAHRDALWDTEYADSRAQGERDTEAFYARIEKLRYEQWERRPDTDPAQNADRHRR